MPKMTGNRYFAEAVQAHGITHVFVNWQEIQRYREPGSYGYTDFVRPNVFDELVRSGLLRPVQAFGELAPRGEDRQTPASQLFVVTVGG